MAWRPKTSASGGFAKRSIEKRQRGIRSSGGGSEVEEVSDSSDAYMEKKYGVGEAEVVEEDSGELRSVKVPAVARGNKRGSVVYTRSGVITVRDEKGNLVYRVRPSEEGYDKGLREYNRAVRSLEKEEKLARSERSRIREYNREVAESAERRGLTAGSWLGELQRGDYSGFEYEVGPGSPVSDVRGRPFSYGRDVVPVSENVRPNVREESGFEKAERAVSGLYLRGKVRRVYEERLGAYESLIGRTYEKERMVRDYYSKFEGVGGVRGAVARGFRSFELGSLKVERGVYGLQIGTERRLEEPLKLGAEVGTVWLGGWALKGGELGVLKLAGRYPKLGGVSKFYRSGEEFLGPAVLTKYGFDVGREVVSVGGAVDRGEVVGRELVSGVGFYGGGRLAGRFSKTTQTRIELEEGFQSLPGGYASGKQGRVRSEFRELKKTVGEIRGVRKAGALPFENVEHLSPEAVPVIRAFVRRYKDVLVVGGSLSSKVQYPVSLRGGLRASSDVDIYSDVPGLAKELQVEFKRAGVQSYGRGDKIWIKGYGKAVEFHALTKAGGIRAGLGLPLEGTIGTVKSGWLPFRSAFVRSEEGVLVTKLKYQAQRKLYGGFEVEVSKSGRVGMPRYSKDIPDYRELLGASREFSSLSTTPSRLALFASTRGSGRITFLELGGVESGSLVPGGVGKVGGGRFKGGYSGGGYPSGGSYSGKVFPGLGRFYPSPKGKGGGYPFVGKSPNRVFGYAGGVGPGFKGGYPGFGGLKPFGGLGGYPKSNLQGYPSGAYSGPLSGYPGFGGKSKVFGYPVRSSDFVFGLEPPKPLIMQDKFFGKSKKKDSFGLVPFGNVYVSSVEARLFGITGKQPKRITGLELRPIVGGR